MTDSAQTIVFDLDGTLVDSAFVCVDILNGMLADRGSVRKIHPAHAKPYFSLGGPRMVKALLAEECGDPDVEIVEFRSRYADLPTPTASLFAGVRDGLHALSAAGHRLAICSNKPQPLCDKVLTDLHLAQLFEVIVGARAGYRPKPATDLLDLALLSLRVPADAALYVGDSEIDHELAGAAGIPFHFVTYGYVDPAWTGQPDMRHDRFADVVTAILGDAPMVTRRVAAAG
jgi:phosphoglycolate phosphatase